MTPPSLGFGTGLAGMACRPLGGFDADALTFFANSAAITDKANLNTVTVGMNSLFGRGNWVLYPTKTGQQATGSTVYKLGSASWAGNASIMGGATIGATGLPLLSASTQYLNIGSWGSGTFTNGIYCGTVHSPDFIANTRGLEIGESDGNPIGGMWAPHGDGNMYWDVLHPTSRAFGASGAVAGTKRMWTGSSVGKCWRDTTQIATVGSTSQLTGNFDRVEVGRNSGSIAANLNLELTFAVKGEHVDTAKHNSFYALLKASIVPGLAALGLAAIYNAYVYPHGNGVEFALTKPLHAISAAGFTVTADGRPIQVVRVVPSGSAGGVYWEAQFADDWINAGEEVVISYNGTQFTPTAGFTVSEANQDSTNTARGLAMWSKRVSMSIHFDPTTYGLYDETGEQWATGAESPDVFNPTLLTTPDDIDNWIAVAQSLNAEAMYLTAKHVGGFCMWYSDARPDYDLRAATTWHTAHGFDIVEAYCDKVRAAGMKVGFYFSTWDRRFEIANPTAKATLVGGAWVPGDTANATAYTALIQDLLTELLDGRYGTIDYLLIDAWEIPGLQYPYYDMVDRASTLALINSLQPDITILENDYDRDTVHTALAMFEAGTGDPIPFSYNRYPALTWMTCTNTNNGWFDDDNQRANYMTAATAGSIAASARARHGTVIYNVSPGITGKFDAFQIAHSAEVGAAIA